METILLMLVVMGVLLFVMSRSGNKKREKAAAQLRENLVPGAWVRTIGCFYGRVVELDGNVVVLETLSGEESLWDIRGIAEVAEPPFAVTEIEDEDGELNEDDEDDDLDVAEEAEETAEVAAEETAAGEELAADEEAAADEAEADSAPEADEAADADEALAAPEKNDK